MGWEKDLLRWDGVVEEGSGGPETKVSAVVGSGMISGALAALDSETVGLVLDADVEQLKKLESEKRAEALIASVVVLRAFQRENVCGPRLVQGEAEVLKRSRLTGGAETKDQLQLDGEEICASVRMGESLLALRKIFGDTEVFKEFWSAPVWAARLGVTYQSMLTGRSPTLRNEVTEGYESVLKAMSESEGDAVIRALLHVELAVASSTFLNSETCKRNVEDAMNVVEVQLKIDGALGVRTKWQKEAKANMVARVTDSGDSMDINIEKDTVRPLNVPLDDPDVLGMTKLTVDENAEDPGPSKLRAIALLVVMANADVVIANNPSGVLTNEEIRPYVSLALESDPSSMPPHLLAKSLLLRTHGERDRGRYIERSMKQIEDLVQFFNRGEPKDGLHRLTAMEAIGFPSMWNLEKEFAILLGGLGLVKSAAEIFESLGLWDEVIDCHRLMGNVEKSRFLIEKQISEEGERPWLLCAMGEVTRDETWYLKAWEKSGGRYAKAKRLQGRMLVSKKQWAEAVDALDQALKINYLYPDIWFLLAYAAERNGDIARQASALTTAVQLDPSNSEAWNNLGSAHMNLGNPKAAVTALQEAAKLRRESWRVWDNLLTASVEANAVRQNMQAQEALLELRGREGVSPNGIAAAVREIEKLAQSKEDADVYQAADLTRRMLQVLGRSSALVSTEPAVWNAYARLHKLGGDSQRELDSRQKEMRALFAQVSQTYTNSEPQFVLVSRAAANLGSAAIRANSDDAKLSAIMQISSILKSCRTNFGDHSMFMALEEAYEHISSEADAA